MRTSCYALARRAMQGDDAALASLRARVEKGVIIACDFDGTLCCEGWPGIGEARQETIDTLKYCMSLGARVILWTCREYDALEAAVQWCRERGLIFDAVNDNLPGIVDMYGVNSRKLSVTEYWDDKAVVPEEEEKTNG